MRTVEQFDAAVAAGAMFTIAPNCDARTVARAREADVLHIPGVFTPNEAQSAFAAGSKILKLFPCDLVGPAHLRALRAPLDDIEFIPTGAIGLDNLALYAAAGAVAVGVGSALISKSDWSSGQITARAKALHTAWWQAVAGRNR